MKKIVFYILGVLLTMVIWAVAVFLATVNGWLHKPIAKQYNAQAFGQAVEATLEKQFVGNFAMATLQDGMVEYEKFHSSGKPVDRNTVFQVASLSKWISAFGIMKMVEDGKLDLDAPVTKYLTRWRLPSSEFNNDDVTARRLLSHTAGLTDGLGYSGFEIGTRVQTIEQSLTKALDADDGITGSVYVGIKPGSAFKYSGGGYTLLQLLVEEITHRSFAAYMKENIFHPLGMLQSTYTWHEVPSISRAELYNADSTRSKPYCYTALAATSLYTTLSDLVLFCQAHLKGKNNEPIGRNVLQPATLKMMRTPHAQQMGVDIWGLGTILYATTNNNDFVIGHDGKSSPPINTAIRLNPDTGDGIIILVTGNPTIATTLASEWVFWKTGKVDTFLFPMLMDEMVWLIAIGWMVMITFAVLFNFIRRVNAKRRHG